MMPKRSVVGSSEPGTKYHRLTRVASDGYIDLQFEKPPIKIPYRAIGLAAVLFMAGTLLIVIGALLLTGVINAKYADRTWPVLIIGALMFIPGAYHVRLAYYAFKGYQGFSYEDIPEFD
ncbi:transmembrane protein 230-like [Littorina saxatilis]|uniref:transmembrane protein 230-like n=1 Tax=Littorina saxatilis TaxID=31220 RepID=UPI0038B62C29